MSKVIVIGGGASGLTAAIHSCLRGNEVIILERNSICGKKIQITGNGHCNYWNEDQGLKHYHTSSNKSLDMLNEYSSETLKFLESIGIIPRIKNGYYYPLSNQAISVSNALIKEAKRLNVDIKNNIFVSKIIKKNNKFKIYTDDNIYEADNVILATGSKSAPKTGSDGIGYEILKSFGHNIVEVLPSLVQIIIDNKITKEWDGVRTNALVSLYIDDKKFKEEAGEVMLTNYGLSGICVFNLSGDVAKNLSKNKSVEISINFLNDLNVKDNLTGVEWLNDFNKKVKNRTISELLDCLLNYKLGNALLKNLKINKDVSWDTLKKSVQEDLINALINYKVKVTGTNSFDKAQVCSGGLSLDEIDMNTMESCIVPGLFICGELLDVDGDCGGYNLSWAWISGLIAGKGTGKDHD